MNPIYSPWAQRVLSVVGLLGLCVVGARGLSHVLNDGFSVGIIAGPGSGAEPLQTAVGVTSLLYLGVVAGRRLILLLLSATHVVATELRASDLRRARSDRGRDPSLSVIVPAYNEAPCICDALHALMRLDYDNYEVIVVDDGSTDDTLSRILNCVAVNTEVPIRVLWQPNTGKAGALNRGLRASTGEIVMVTDADSVLTSETVLAAVRHFDEPSVGAVAGHVEVVNRTSWLAKFQMLEYRVGSALNKRAQSVFGAVSIVPGPVGVFRRSALRRIGEYERDTFAEDYDLSQKLLLGGYKVVHEPMAVAYTEAPEKLAALFSQRYRWARGILQVLRKRSTAMLQMHGAPRGTVTLWLMAQSAVLWPPLNVAALTTLLWLCWSGDLASGLFSVVAQLLCFDVAILGYCLAVTGKSLEYALLGPIVRFFYQPLLDVAKTVALVEEILELRMQWGKMDRLMRTSVGGFRTH